MATLVGIGYVEIVPRLVPTFAPQLQAQMMAGTALATAGAAKGATAAGAATGAAAGKGLMGGMRGALAGMSGMIKGVVGIAAAVGIVEFAKASADAFRRVASESLTLQRVMGGTIQEASGWRAVGERFGVTSAQMSVSMKTLAKDMTSGKGPLVALGIASKDSTGHLRPMGSVLMDVADKFKMMPDGAGKSRLAVELFGKSGLALLPILNRGSGGIKDLMAAADKMGLVLDASATDKVKKLAESQRDMTAAALGVKVAFGEKLVPVLTKFYSFLATEVIPAVGKFLGFLEDNGTAVKIFATALISLVVGMKVYAAAMATWTALTKAWTVVTRLAAAAQLAFNAAFVANPIGLVVAAIAAAVAAVVLLWTHWDQVWNWISHHKAYAIIIAVLGAAIVLPIFALVAAGRFLQKNWHEIWTTIQAVAVLVVHDVVAAIQALQRAWNTVWGAMSIVIGPVWDVIRSIVSAGMTALSVAISVGMTVIRAVWGPAWTVISTVFSAAWTVIRTIAVVGMTIVRDVISVGMAVIRAVWGPAWTVISTLLSVAWTIIKGVVSVGMTLVRTAIEVGMTIIRAVWGPAWAVISTLLSAAWTVIRTVVSLGMTAVRTVIEVALAVIRPLWSATWTVISTLFNTVWTVMKAIVGAAMTVIRGVISVGLTAISALWHAVWTTIYVFFGTVWGYLRLAVTTGTNAIRTVITIAWGIVKGIFVSVWNAISSFFHGIWGVLQLTVGTATRWIHATISTMWNLVKGVFQTIWNAISSFFSGLWNGLKAIVGAATGWVHDRVSSVWNLVRGVFVSVWNNISGFFSGIWNTLKDTVGRAIGWVHDKIRDVMSVISDIWSRAWSGVRDTFKSIWDTIVNIFKKPVNIILSAVRTFDHIINNITDFVGMGRHLPEGGDVPTLARGGKLSGYGGGDILPAMLEPGEAVVPKHLVPEMSIWARNRGIPGFAAGGVMGAGMPELGAFSIPNPIDIAKKAVSGVIDLGKSAAGAVANVVGGIPGVSNIMGALGAAKDWVVEGIKDAFRIGAAEALKGLLAPVRKAFELATGPFAKPGEMLRGVANKTLDGIIEWVRGKEQAPPSSGGDMGSGTWSPGMAVLVKQIVDKWHISAMTYAGHDPDAQHAADFALDQFGVIWDYNTNNPNNKYSQIARWIADNIVDKHRGQRFYVGTMASIHNAQRDLPGQWRPIASQQRGGALDNATKGHHDHVHFSSPIDFGGTGAVGIGGGPVHAVTGSVGTPGNYATYSGYLGMHWTQAAIEFAAKKMGADPNMAHILSAIAMAEAMPIGKFITNSTGTYTGAWAFQQAWAAKQYDWGRLSNDLDYDAIAAINLYRASPFGPTHMKWETWPGAAAKFMAAGGLVQSYDAGGYLPTGLSLAYNGTGRPESVGGGTQNNYVSLTLNLANGDPVTIRATAQRVVDDALATLARRLSSGAGRN